jgi:hypothetical protein
VDEEFVVVQRQLVTAIRIQFKQPSCFMRGSARGVATGQSQGRGTCALAIDTLCSFQGAGRAPSEFDDPEVKAVGPCRAEPRGPGFCTWRNAGSPGGVVGGSTYMGEQRTNRALSLGKPYRPISRPATRGSSSADSVCCTGRRCRPDWISYHCPVAGVNRWALTRLSDQRTPQPRDARSGACRPG